MKILLIAIGTRGDCEPFAGLGEMLRGRGEDVYCCFPEQYRNVAEESGFPFHSLGEDFLGILNTKDGKTFIGGRAAGKFKAYIKMMKHGLARQKKITQTQIEIIEEINPDIIIHHSKCLFPLPYAMKNNKKAIFFALQPGIVHEVKGMPHIGLPGKFPARLSYKIITSLMAKMIANTAQKVYGRGNFMKTQIKDALLAEPMLYNFSPSLFPRPDYWAANLMVGGFWDRNKTQNYKPPDKLLKFFETHEKPILITFGSMTNPRPEELSKMFVDILQELNIPAIINTSGGGLPKIENYDRDLIMFVNSIPYDWALPRVYATIHHGGAGTTHSSIRAGCATMIIPHIADQPMWNKITAEQGLGPFGIPVGKVRRDLLKAKIRDLYENPSYKQKAEEISSKMANENFAAQVYEFITR